MKLDTIKLFSAVHFLTETPNAVAAKWVAALNLELASFGYTMSPRLIDAVSSLSQPTFDALRKELLAYLATLTGANANHMRLFTNFPYETPDQHAYFVQRVIGFVRNMFDAALVSDGTILDCGHVIDTRDFNLAEFGACPICQFGVLNIASNANENVRHDFKQLTPLKALDYLSLEGLSNAVNGLLARQSSLSADEKAFVMMPEWRFILRVPEKIYRENIPLVFKATGYNVEAMIPALTSMTDIMRIAYYLAAETNDLSLKENAKFTLTTSERKKVLKLVDGYVSYKPKAALSDMLRDRERWLRLGETINPGSAKNRVKYASANMAFNVLRNNSKEIFSFNREVEKGLRNGNPESIVSVLATRPGVFARRLDETLRKSPMDEREEILYRFGGVADKVPTSLLLNMMKHFRSRESSDQRVFFIKGERNKVHVDERARPVLDPATTIMARATVEAALRKQMIRPDMPEQSIYIDPVLDDLVVPFNRRGDSSTISPILKGSRYPFVGDVLRMFVHWRNGERGRTDVDLSANLLNSDFKRLQTVAFTDLEGYGCIHSGDIQDAPNGASEFIDIDVEAATRSGVRYVTMICNVYYNGMFSDFPCFAGFMERDSLRSGSVFQPETVRFKFDCDGKSTTVTPLIFDLVERRVIFADMTAGTKSFSAITSQNIKQTALTKAALSIPERKPTFGDLARLLVSANKVVPADNRERAETVWDENSLDDIIALAGI